MDRRSENGASLVAAIKAILLTEWDPIRLQELPSDMRDANHDEYDAYIEPIARLIQDHCTEFGADSVPF
jgi:hypothetical protein